MADPEDLERFEMLKFTYQEVLDATKHQDDKINRLLTTIAFLTAAALALAGLDSAVPVRASFTFEHGIRLPLGLITLGSFLVGVAISGVMLIASLTTPLQFPGGKKSVVPDIRYAEPKPAKTGQVYFNEIASVSLPEWWIRWKQDLPTLQQERNDSLVRETHNLAVRTEFKYQRSNEAVAVLSFALISFGVSTVLVLIAASKSFPASAAGSSEPIVDLDLRVRSLLAAVLFVFYWLQLLATRRTPDTVLERAVPRGSKNQEWSIAVYPPVVALVPTLLVLRVPGPVWVRLVIGLIAPFVALGFFLAAEQGVPASNVHRRNAAQNILAKYGFNVPDEVPPPAKNASEKFSQRLVYQARNLRNQAKFVAVAFACGGVWAAVSGTYGINLAFAAGLGIVTVLASVLKVNKHERQRSQRFKARLEKYSVGSD